MKKKFLSVLFVMILVLAMAGCGSKEKDTQLSAVSRDPSADDGTVWFDDEAVALAGAVKSNASKSQELSEMAKDILELVNAERSAKGLSALSWSKGLESCAKVRAQECQQKFSHTRPNGKDWYTVNSKLMWGENLAKGYESAEEVVQAWMDSPTHKENIMTSDFKTCSIAIYESDGKLYFAQEFGY